MTPQPGILSLWWSLQGSLTLWLSLSCLALIALSRYLAPAELPRLRLQIWLLLLHFALGWTAANRADPFDDNGHSLTLLAAQLLGVAISAALFNALVFGIALSRFQRSVPAVLRDMLSVVALIVATVVLLSKHGFDVKSLLPTGAVLTAVVGIALQQTLGNLIGGMSIQLDKSVRVGDWISVDGLYGRVASIKWRYTSIETNDWETVVIPNSALVAGKVTVRGRRGGQETPWRRWVRFRLPHSASPAEVLRLAEQCLIKEPLESVAPTPLPSAVLLSVEEGVAQYALRYWLTDLLHDDAVDSAVRMRLIYALRRAGMEPALPAHQITLVEGSEESRQREVEAREAKREQALGAMELFHTLQPAELKRLARSLRDVPFAPGEALVRQGDEADSLYLIAKGQVSIRVLMDGSEKEVAQLSQGSYFGEMGLMTGEPRNATVQALTHVDTYHLDKEAFRALLQLRPELVDSVAEVLAKRRVELEQAKESLDQASKLRRQHEAKGHMLERIKAYFGHRA
jgi:small-conductance mechanosensitive channel/CRP-like cAMP-binding protein